MMQPAEDWNCCDAADLLRPPKIRSISCPVRDASGPVVIRSVSLQDTAQVRFAEHDEVVERFATDRSDEALNVAVLPRRAWRRRVISDPHCTNAAGVRWTECAVAVANQVTRRFVPGKGIAPLYFLPSRAR